eukprot:3425108-Prymnesium_polylepis.1
MEALVRDVEAVEDECCANNTVFICKYVLHAKEELGNGGVVEHGDEAARGVVAAAVWQDELQLRSRHQSRPRCFRLLVNLLQRCVVSAQRLLSIPGSDDQALGLVLGDVHLLNEALKHALLAAIVQQDVIEVRNWDAKVVAPEANAAILCRGH